LSGRPWSWITGRPRFVDGLVVAISVALGVASAFGTTARPPVLLALLSISTAASVALWWRRTHSEAVLLFVIVASIVAFAIAPDRDPSNPALLFVAYAISAYGRRTGRLLVVAAAIALVLGGVALLLFDDFKVARMLMPPGVTSLIAWVVGDYIRSRRQFMSDLVARHRQEREQAAEAERLRIARELHDVVAHNVSVMAIQAGAARVSGISSEQTLKDIEQGARDTLAELNKLLGVLRKSPDAPALAPQPKLEDVDALLKPARDAGLEATLKITGEQRSLPGALDLSAYRIVQEALTNVLKHAGASRVEVTVDYQADAVALTISDNGNGASSAPSGGHGLIGMRERVDLFGGDLTTGSSSLGGFTVRATLPVKA
jgi:signal transduction histidine kinase